MNRAVEIKQEKVRLKKVIVMSVRHLSKTVMRVAQVMRENAFSKPASVAARGVRSSDNSTASNLVIKRASATKTSAEGINRMKMMKKKEREAEKAENVMHLICWGPK